MQQVVRNLFLYFQRSRMTGILLLAVVVGFLGGLFAVAFQYLIIGVNWLCFHWLLDQLADWLPWLLGLALLPLLGAAPVAWLVDRFARETQGHGIPEVIYAMRRAGGRIRPRVALVKALASALTIGTGGSVGREGPMAQIGAALGSALGQLFRLSVQRVRLLVACGVAAGVAAAFNAPIAGAFFALEVVLQGFETRAFAAVVLASVTGTAVSRWLLHSRAALELTHQYSLAGFWEFPFYVLLGLLAGLVAIAFVRALYYTEDRFGGWRASPVVKALTGMAIVGLLGWIVPQVLGTGYGVGYDYQAYLVGGGSPKGPMWDALNGQDLALLFVLALLMAKLCATALTLGSGGSGGVFAPALFLGAMLGRAFGQGLERLFPGTGLDSRAYAIVGMAAVFAGAAHAPITAILILFEMTGDYELILPLMLGVVTSTVLSQRLQRDSIYTLKVRRRGGYLEPSTAASSLEQILVADAMITDVQTTAPETPLAEVAELFHRSHTHALPVVDAAGRLHGIVSLYDVEEALLHGEERLRKLTVGEVAARRLITCFPDETLAAVLERFGARDVRQLLVVRRDDPQRLLGLVRRTEILWAYQRQADEARETAAALRRRSGSLSQAGTEELAVVELALEGGSPLIGRRVRELGMPAHCRILSIARGDRIVVPDGATRLEPGDLLHLAADVEHERALRGWLDRQAPPRPPPPEAAAEEM